MMSRPHLRISAVGAFNREWLLRDHASGNGWEPDIRSHLASRVMPSGLNRARASSL
jgi:hypothetical protein